MEVRSLKKEIKSSYVGTKDAAKMLGVSQSTISRYCRESIIKNAEQDAPGSPWRIPIEEIEKIKRRKNR